MPPLSLARTALWALAILVVAAAGQVLAAALVPAAAAGLRADGLVFSLGILIGSLAGGALLLWVLRGRDPRAYLALTRPRLAHLALWLLLGAALLALQALAAHLLGRPAIPELWRATWRATDAAWLLVLALVVVAPIFEEMYFRGFLHRGRAPPPRPPPPPPPRPPPNTLVHAPEDAWTLAHGLLNALLLGLARHHTGSILPGIAVHAGLNALVLVQLALA
jgi:membrane protease YdiL (CAAX protease family)